MSSVKLPPITEKKFSRQVEQYARLMGWQTYHSWISIRSRPGFPDLVMVRRKPYDSDRSRIIFAELKTDLGKTTMYQEEWIYLLSACPGVETHVWRPSDWLQIEKVLR